MSDDKVSMEDGKKMEEEKPAHLEIRFEEIEKVGGASNDIFPNFHRKQSEGNAKEMEATSGENHSRSCMEEESLRERFRNTLLKECSHILRQEELKYTRETLRRVFQDEVSFFI
jgi:hypothetical protein